MASVKQAWIKKYGEEEGLRKWKNHCKTKLANTEENYINRYGKEIGKIKYKEYIKGQKGKGSLDFYIKKYGHIDGPIKYQEKNSKLSVSTEALKKNGYSDDEIEDIQNRHRENSLNNYDDYIKRYGKEEGKERYDLMCERKRLHSKRSLDYWINYHNGDIELAKQSLKEYQTHDRSYFIRKYGEINGIELYEDYVQRKTKNWKNKTYNKSKGQVQVEEYIRNLFEEKVYGHKEHYGIFLNKQEQELLNQKVIFPDILIKDKIIIEYFGDFWHANKNMFDDEHKKHPYIDLTIREIREKDNIKKQLLEDRGFQYFVIWETDWKNNKEHIKKELREIL